MRSVVLLLACLLPLTVTSESRMVTRDDFEGSSLNRNLWTTPDHALGHGQVRGENVSVSDGKLYLKMPANSLDGAEIKSVRGDYQYGSYTIRMKAPPASQTYLAPFLWTDPDFHSEIDVEVHNDGSRTTFFNTYEGPEVDPPDTIQQEVVTLPFDPSAGFHDYRWEYASGYVKFYVDDTHYWTVNERIPPSEMHLFVNVHWPEQFQSPRELDRDIYAEIEYVEVEPLPGTADWLPTGVVMLLKDLVVRSAYVYWSYPLTSPFYVSERL